MSELAIEIERFIVSAESPVAFCGAGVSARAGLPVWHSLLSKLAEQFKETDRTTFEQMKEKYIRSYMDGLKENMRPCLSVKEKPGRFLSMTQNS